MLWFAGAGCVFVSYAHGAMSNSEVATGEITSHHLLAKAQRVSGADANHSAVSVLSDSVSFAGAHSCCKARRTAARQDVSAQLAPATGVTVAAERTNSSPLPKQSTTRRSGTLQRQQKISAVGVFATELAGMPPPSGSMNCCPLNSAAATVTTKPRASDTLVAASVERTSLPAFPGNAETSPLTSPLRLPNRGHTYLRCCVFLI